MDLRWSTVILIFLPLLTSSKPIQKRFILPYVGITSPNGINANTPPSNSDTTTNNSFLPGALSLFASVSRNPQVQTAIIEALPDILAAVLRAIPRNLSIPIVQPVYTNVSVVPTVAVPVASSTVLFGKRRRRRSAPVASNSDHAHATFSIPAFDSFRNFLNTRPQLYNIRPIIFNVPESERPNTINVVQSLSERLGDDGARTLTARTAFDASTGARNGNVVVDSLREGQSHISSTLSDDFQRDSFVVRHHSYDVYQTGEEDDEKEEHGGSKRYFVTNIIVAKPKIEHSDTERGVVHDVKGVVRDVKVPDSKFDQMSTLLNTKSTQKIKEKEFVVLPQAPEFKSTTTEASKKINTPETVVPEVVQEPEVVLVTEKPEVVFVKPVEIAERPVRIHEEKPLNIVELDVIEDPRRKIDNPYQRNRFFTTQVEVRSVFPDLELSGTENMEIRVPFDPKTAMTPPKKPATSFHKQLEAESASVFDSAGNVATEVASEVVQLGRELIDIKTEIGAAVENNWENVGTRMETPVYEKSDFLYQWKPSRTPDIFLPNADDPEAFNQRRSKKLNFETVEIDELPKVTSRFSIISKPFIDTNQRPVYPPEVSLKKEILSYGSLGEVPLELSPLDTPLGSTRDSYGLPVNGFKK